MYGDKDRRAASSLTSLVEVIARRKHFMVRKVTGEVAIGSKGGLVSERNTNSKSHMGGMGL